MAKNRTILDCYTDEPAGLGVPPFLGVWPRYAAGEYRDLPNYITIDDLRLAKWKGKIKDKTIDPPTGKTRNDLLNTTRDVEETREILDNTDQLIIVCGIQTPGKYLSARPGTITEVRNLISGYRFSRILTGPVVRCGSQIRGGGSADVANESDFNELRELKYPNYKTLQDVAVEGANIYEQIPDERVIELETGRGCSREIGCSFCTEPLKNDFQWREAEDIVAEAKRFSDMGAMHFRLGKQSCIFSYQSGDYGEIEKLVRGISKLEPEIFHIDNANPGMVDRKRAELFVKYLTAGSTAAMGVESFDPEVAKKNNLNCRPEQVMEAIRILNEVGGDRGENGCHYMLPGINILLGLTGETKKTLERNFEALKEILDEGLLIRRINIRQVVAFPGTRLYEEAGNRYLKKNHKYYAPWIARVRREIDLPMLERLFPKGTVLRRVRSEVHEGQVTFLRQMGSYPIVIGIRERLPLKKYYDVKICGHMLRSLTGEVVNVY